MKIRLFYGREINANGKKTQHSVSREEGLYLIPFTDNFLEEN